MRKLFFLAFLLFGFLIGTSAIAQITILSGPEQGSYHQFVSDLEKLLNNDSVKLIVNQPTQGATINLENIANPQSPFKVALVQEDYMFIMQNKDILQRTKTMSDIQVIYPFVKEEIHLVTRKDKSINTLKDISDSTLVSIGKIRRELSSLPMQ